MRLAVLAAALAAIGLAPDDARAELRVCNQTLNFYNLAVARLIDTARNEWETEGWWTIPANSCVTPITEPLTSKYVYVYATDIYGDAVISGSQAFCVDSKKFRIDVQENCWTRGLMLAKFREVDTLESENWTVFIREKTG